MAQLHLAVCRRQTEDLGWLQDLPAGSVVRLYNEGEPLDALALPPTWQLIEQAGGGMTTMILRELRQAPLDPQAHVVFTGAAPWDEAPALAELLQEPQRWGEVQPLSVRERDGAPGPLVECDARDWIGALAVRPVRFSTVDLAPLHHRDAATAALAERHRAIHALPEGTALLAHALEQIGLSTLAGEARGADLGLYAAGEIFAVRGARIAALRAGSATALERLQTLCEADPHYRDLARRLWLHLLGQPFVRLDALPRPAEVHSPASLGLARVMASIDAVLAHGDPAGRPARMRRADPASPPPQAPTVVPDLREQARAARAAGEPEQAMALLEQALAAAPEQVDLLAEAASLAFQRGDLAHAVPLARRALLLDPLHAASRFTLAMSLAALGDHYESLSLFDSLMHADSAREFRCEHPELASVAAQQSQHLHRLQQIAVRQDRLQAQSELTDA